MPDSLFVELYAALHDTLPDEPAAAPTPTPNRTPTAMPGLSVKEPDQSRGWKLAEGHTFDEAVVDQMRQRAQRRGYILDVKPMRFADGRTRHHLTVYHPKGQRMANPREFYAADQGQRASTAELPDLHAETHGRPLHEFLDRRVTELLPAHMETGQEPAEENQVHAYFDPKGVDPSEHHNWNDLAKDPLRTSRDNIAGMVKTLQGGGQLPPVLMRGTPDDKQYRPTVIDGHHRMVAHLQHGSTSVPAVYDHETLVEIWARANGMRPNKQLLKRLASEYDQHIRQRAASQPPEQYAARKIPSSPGQRSMFDEGPTTPGGKHDVSQEPRDETGEWTAGGTVHPSERPDAPQPQAPGPSGGSGDPPQPKADPLPGSTESPAVHHDWEERIGKPGYEFVALASTPTMAQFGDNVGGYQNAAQEVNDLARAHDVQLGMCHVCGTPLLHNYICRNADGKAFVVGSECVNKLNDTRLSTDIQERERDRQRDLRIARNAQRRKQETAAREAEERKLNNGKTLAEIRAENAKQEAVEIKARQAQAGTDNQWLIDRLKTHGGGGGFVQDMIDKLSREPLAKLPDRAVSVLRDIWAKSFGKRGAKYEDAVEEFDNKLDPQESQHAIPRYPQGLNDMKRFAKRFTDQQLTTAADTFEQELDEGNLDYAKWQLGEWSQPGGLYEKLPDAAKRAFVNMERWIIQNTPPRGDEKKTQDRALGMFTKAVLPADQAKYTAAFHDAFVDRYARLKSQAGQLGLFDEQHPRGQPENAGEFKSKGDAAPVEKGSDAPPTPPPATPGTVHGITGTLDDWHRAAQVEPVRGGYRVTVVMGKPPTASSFKVQASNERQAVAHAFKAHQDENQGNQQADQGGADFARKAREQQQAMRAMAAAPVSKPAEPPEETREQLTDRAVDAIGRHAGTLADWEQDLKQASLDPHNAAGGVHALTDTTGSGRTWAEILQSKRPVAEQNGVKLYSDANQHMIVKDGQVHVAYGFKGRALFDKLAGETAPESPVTHDQWANAHIFLAPGTKAYAIQAGKAKGTLFGQTNGKWWIVRPDLTRDFIPDRYGDQLHAMVAGGNAQEIQRPDTKAPADPHEGKLFQSDLPSDPAIEYHNGEFYYRGQQGRGRKVDAIKAMTLRDQLASGRLKSFDETQSGPDPDIAGQNPDTPTDKNARISQQVPTNPDITGQDPDIGTPGDTPREWWQVPLKEYAREMHERTRPLTKSGKSWDQWLADGIPEQDLIHLSGAGHEAYVKDAIEKGLPVPESVLADYPDLKPADDPVDPDIALGFKPPATLDEAWLRRQEGEHGKPQSLDEARRDIPEVIARWERDMISTYPHLKPTPAPGTTARSAGGRPTGETLTGPGGGESPEPKANTRAQDEARLRDELKELRARRKELISLYGDQGQHHPSARMIGGLNSAARELHMTRGRIAQIEQALTADVPKPTLTPKYGIDLKKKSHPMGLLADARYRNKTARIGKDNLGRYYAIDDESDKIVIQDARTINDATKAWMKHVDTPRPEQHTALTSALLREYYAQRFADRVVERYAEQQIRLFDAAGGSPRKEFDETKHQRAGGQFARKFPRVQSKEVQPALPGVDLPAQRRIVTKKQPVGQNATAMHNAKTPETVQPAAAPPNREEQLQAAGLEMRSMWDQHMQLPRSTRHRALTDLQHSTHQMLESRFGESLSRQDATTLLNHVFGDELPFDAEDIVAKPHWKGEYDPAGLMLDAHHRLWENERERRRAEAVEQAGDAKALKFAKPNSPVHFVVHPAAHADYQGQWQITRFDDRGPSGHQYHKTKEEAIGAAIGAHPNSYWDEGDSDYRLVEQYTLDRAKGDLYTALWCAQQGLDRYKATPEGPFTNEWHEWFGDSKIRNRHGHPLTVYHGTREDFEALDTSDRGFDDSLANQLGDNIGGFFTTRPSTANDFAQRGKKAGHRLTTHEINANQWPEGAAVIPAHLSIKNPKLFRTQEEWRAFLKQSPNARQAMEQAGHDGVVIRRAGYSKPDSKETWIVAFHPHQVKSIHNPRPTEDPRMMYALRPDPRQQSLFGPVTVETRSNQPGVTVQSSLNSPPSTTANMPQLPDMRARASGGLASSLPPPESAILPPRHQARHAELLAKGFRRTPAEQQEFQDLGRRIEELRDRQPVTREHYTETPSHWQHDPTPPVDESQYIDADEHHKKLWQFYHDRNASSRTTPSELPNPPVGSWRMDKHFGIYGREIEQLRMVPVHELTLSEGDYTDPRVNDEGRGDDARRYAGWMKEHGLEHLPPIHVVETDQGTHRVMNGHRRTAAAKLAGMTHIPAWVSPRMKTGKKYYGQDLDIGTGLTYEGAHHGAEAASKMYEERQRKLSDSIRAERAAKENAPAPESYSQQFRDAILDRYHAQQPERYKYTPPATPRFEPADPDHYIETARRNAQMRLPRQGESAEDAEDARIQADWTPHRAEWRRKLHKRDNVHLVDVPTHMLQISQRDLAPERKARLEQLQGTDDPVMASIDHHMGTGELSINVDDGNNRAQWHLDHGSPTVPVFLHEHRPGDMEKMRQIIAPQHAKLQRATYRQSIQQAFLDRYRDLTSTPEQAPPTTGEPIHHTRTPEFKRFFGDWEAEPHNASKVRHPEGHPRETHEIAGTGSRVKGPTGQPIPVYHGTAQGGFQAFDPAKASKGSLYGPGFYFTEDPEIAKEYTEKGMDYKLDRPITRRDMDRVRRFLQSKAAIRDARSDIGIRQAYQGVAMNLQAAYDDNDPKPLENVLRNTEAGEKFRKMLGVQRIPTNTPEVKTAYLNIRKPFDIDVGHNDELRARLADTIKGTKPEELLQYTGEDEDFLPSLQSNMGAAFRAIQPMMGPTQTGAYMGATFGQKIYDTLVNHLGKSSANHILQKAGFDGITHTGGSRMGKKPHRVWIAFKPHQIKSVTNRGTWDPEDERMDYEQDQNPVAREPYAQFQELVALASELDRYKAKDSPGQRHLFNEEDHPRAPEGAKGGAGGQFVEKKADYPVSPEVSKLRGEEDAAHREAKSKELDRPRDELQRLRADRERRKAANKSMLPTEEQFRQALEAIQGRTTEPSHDESVANPPPAGAPGAESRQTVGKNVGKHDNEELLARVQSGDRQAFDQLLAQNRPFIADRARKAGAREGRDLEDWIQEGSVILWQAAAKFDPQQGNRFTTYLGTALDRRFWKLRKKEIGSKDKPKPRHLQGAVDDEGRSINEPLASPDEAPLADQELKQAVRTVVKKIPNPRHQQIVGLAFGLDGPPLTHAQIAEQLGVKPQAVQQQLARILPTLQRQLQDQYAARCLRDAVLERYHAIAAGTPVSYTQAFQDAYRDRYGIRDLAGAALTKAADWVKGTKANPPTDPANHSRGNPATDATQTKRRGGPPATEKPVEAEIVRPTVTPPEPSPAAVAKQQAAAKPLPPRGVGAPTLFSKVGVPRFHTPNLQAAHEALSKLHDKNHVPDEAKRITDANVRAHTVNIRNDQAQYRDLFAQQINPTREAVHARLKQQADQALAGAQKEYDQRAAQLRAAHEAARQHRETALRYPEGHPAREKMLAEVQEAQGNIRRHAESLQGLHREVKRLHATAPEKPEPWRGWGTGESKKPVSDQEREARRQEREAATQTAQQTRWLKSRGVEVPGGDVRDPQYRQQVAALHGEENARYLEERKQLRARREQRLQGSPRATRPAGQPEAPQDPLTIANRAVRDFQDQSQHELLAQSIARRAVNERLKAAGGAPLSDVRQLRKFPGYATWYKRGQEQAHDHLGRLAQQAIETAEQSGADPQEIQRLRDAHAGKMKLRPRETGLEGAQPTAAVLRDDQGNELTPEQVRARKAAQTRATNAQAKAERVEKINTPQVPHPQDLPQHAEELPDEMRAFGWKPPAGVTSAQHLMLQSLYGLHGTPQRSFHDLVNETVRRQTGAGPDGPVSEADQRKAADQIAEQVRDAIGKTRTATAAAAYGMDPRQYHQIADEAMHDEVNRAQKHNALFDRLNSAKQQAQLDAGDDHETVLRGFDTLAYPTLQEAEVPGLTEGNAMQKAQEILERGRVPVPGPHADEWHQAVVDQLGPQPERGPEGEVPPPAEDDEEPVPFSARRATDLRAELYSALWWATTRA